VQRFSQKEVLAYCIKNKISFSISRQPGCERDVLLVSKNVSAFDKNQMSEFLSRDGYIIAPFSFKKNKGVFLENSYTIESSISDDVFNEIVSIKGAEEIYPVKNFYADYESYLQQFNCLFTEIQKEKIQKAILSRVKHFDSFSDSYADELYYKLSSLYPSAYSFMYYTPYTGLWIGATPELLLKVDENYIKTVSLAGTRSLVEVDSEWNKKELNEQQIVSDYMEFLFAKYKIENYQMEGPESVAAGKISHLKTSYNFQHKDLNLNISDFIADLHPTPAVCGLPKHESMDVIDNAEIHERSYYSGFIGNVNNVNMGLFVNIRSLKFVDGGVDLYLGGGITAGSQPLNEWQETELKSSTLLDVIQDLIKK